MLSSALSESTHLELRDNETAFVNRVYNLSCVHVYIRFDHRESGFFSSCIRGSRESIAVVYNLELSGVNCEN